MKSLNIVFVAAGLTLISVPALAQQLTTNSAQDFLDAVQKRDGNKATELVQSHPTIIDTKDGKGDTALIMVIRADDRDWTGFMLRNHADPNMPGAGGDTPLITAARSGFDEAVPWLVGLGAKVDGTNRAGETPLIIAVQQRDVRTVKALLDAGADPDHADSVAGYSARDYAARDSRARDILKLINNKKPKGGSVAAN
ncbi:MAG: ankyrin repeat domain-containing protein [Sphingomonas sp.]|nr:ankyrin repeat domain-containing protein [Sphingomonas sp.]